MYLTGVIMYLIWPAFIALSWFVIRFALDMYGKKFPEEQ